MARPSPSLQLQAQLQEAVAHFTAAMQPVADAYLQAAAQLGAGLSEWARQVTTALEAAQASHGTRTGRGDPTGDPPL